MPSTRDAAPWMWTLAAALVMCGGCTSLAGLMFLLLDTAFMQEVISEMPPEQAEALRNEDPLMAVTLLAISIFGVLLAVTLAILGFGVRAGHRGTTQVARVVMILVLVGLGGFALLTLVGGLVQGQPVQLAISLLMVGIPTALAALATARLFGRGPTPSTTRRSDDDEPWNAHLGG
ncbi:MAG: hypothetical protein AAF586_02730 [Planctomycetota bacterium]